MKKYIVFADGTTEVFDETEIHSWVAGAREVVSAGKCWGDDNMVLRVGGESTTLGIKSRPEDVNHIQKWLIGKQLTPASL